MFGTLGISELIIILVIVMLIFGSSRLPALGEGVGKALKGFKKAVHEEPPPLDPNAPNASNVPQAGAQPPAHIEEAQVVQAQATPAQPGAPAASKPTAPYQPGPELTPGTTASLMASAAPQAYQPPKPKGAPQTAQPAIPTGQTMEERQAGMPQTRAAYPPVPAGAQAKAPVKRPSAIVNKEAVARVQAQQAALKAKATQDAQSLGESLGDALRTFRQAAADVRNTIDPEMRTIQAEMDAAKKEVEQSIEAAKELPAVQEDPPKPA
ncbi:MAG: twin-arginine translocase TatA/TatE family subunit [Nitrospiraceae bacterium]